MSPALSAVVGPADPAAPSTSGEDVEDETPEDEAPAVSPSSSSSSSSSSILGSDLSSLFGLFYRLGLSLRFMLPF